MIVMDNDAHQFYKSSNPWLGNHPSDLSLPFQKNGCNVTRLVYWYGIKDPHQAYSFFSKGKIIHYDEGVRMGYCEIPKPIQQKIDKESELTKIEKQIWRGLIEIILDMKKDRNDRAAWMMQWKEDFDNAEEKEELKSKLDRLDEEEDAPQRRGVWKAKESGGYGGSLYPRNSQLLQQD